MKSGTRKLSTLFCLAAACFSAACSIKRLAMNQVAGALTAPGGGQVFTGDNDPELVGDALPFAIKMYESLLDALPNHRGLQLQTGSLYVMYANAFLQVPAEMLSAAEYQKQEFLLKRAKNLYLRGRDILLRGLDQRHPGFMATLQKKQYDQALKPLRRNEVPCLYWAGMGWLGAFAIDPFDMDLGITLPKAEALVQRVLELDETFRDGAIHDFFTLYYGSLPEYMGGDLKKARHHFELALILAKGKSSSPYLSLATTVSIKENKPREFRALLEKALAFDPDSDPENRLVNILNQRKARWLLEHRDDFFLEEEPTPADNSTAVRPEHEEIP